MKILSMIPFGGVIGILGIIIALHYHTDIFRRMYFFFLRPRDVRKLMKELQRDYGFERHPKSKIKPCKYLSRRKDHNVEVNSNTKLSPSFHLLVGERKGIKIESFRGFLIPPLDYGHGITNHDDTLSKDLDEKWRRYFLGLKYELEHSKTPNGIKNERIVFFDKFFLDGFLKLKNEVFETAGKLVRNEATSSPNAMIEWQFQESKQPQHLVSMARVIIKIALDTWKVHDFHVKNGCDKLITTYYLDKAAVQSNQYYDFGFFQISKWRPIVYVPVYSKDIHKVMKEEKFYFGKTELVKEFIDDFAKVKKIYLNQIVLRNNTDESKDYHAYSFKEFHNYYYDKLDKIFKDKLVV